MNLIRNSICLIWFMFVMNINILAQTPKQFDILKDEIQLAIPPLSLLLDSALANDPLVNFRDKQISVNQYKLNLERNYWMRDIGFQADVRYGNFDNFSTNTSEGQTPATYSTSRSETKYGIGAYIKFPVFDLINQRTKSNLAKFEIKQAEDMLAMQSDEVKQKVIRQYNELIVNQKLLQLKAKYLETARINMLMTEKEFINGVISVTEYSRLSSIYWNAEESYESAKMNFRTSYMILEEIVGIKLNVKFDAP